MFVHHNLVLSGLALLKHPNKAVSKSLLRSGAAAVVQRKIILKLVPLGAPMGPPGEVLYAHRTPMLIVSESTAFGLNNFRL